MTSPLHRLASALAGLAALISWPAPLHAQVAGSLDPGFNPHVRGNDIVHATAVQSDGKILLAGNFISEQMGGIVRLHSDGTVENTATFNAGTGANGVIHSLALQPDGRILIGGEFSMVNGQTRIGIHRLDAGGTPETAATFNPGTGPNGPVHCIAVQTDGKILIGGDFTSVNGQPRGRIARLHPDGTLEDTATFNPGTGANGNIYSIAVDADASILLGGAFTAMDGQLRAGIARLHPDGTVAPSFNPVMGANLCIYSIAVDADGKIVLGGNFTDANDEPRTGITRLHPNGTVESSTTFDPGGGTDGFVTCVKVQPDGKILIGGNFTSMHAQPRNRIARLHADGTLESTETFNPGTGVETGIVHSMALAGNGRIVIGGAFTAVNGQPRSSSAQLHADGRLVAGFTAITGSYGGILTMVQQPDGKTLVGGSFESMDGQPRNGIARLHPDGSLEDTATFNAGAGGLVFCIAVQDDGKILVGGAFYDVNGQPRTNIARLHPDGRLESTATFDPGTGADDRVYAMAVQADGKILIGGDFSTVNGQPRNRIARLNADGTLESTATFNPGTGVSGNPGNVVYPGHVYSILVDADGRILLGGEFTRVNGESRNNIARLNADGTLESTATFNAGTDALIYRMVPQPNGKILLGGTFRTVNGQARGGIARIHANGDLESTVTFDPGFGTNGGASIYCIAVQADGRILIGGRFETVNNDPRANFARLHSNGALESTATFNPGTGPNNVVYSVIVQENGKILIGGFFTSVNTGESRGIARLETDGTLERTANLFPVDGATGHVQCAAVQADGKILIGGWLTTVNGQARGRIARLHADGTLESTATFNPGQGPNSGVYAIAVQADGKILIGGAFTTIDGQPRSGIARLHDDGSLESTATFNPGTGAGSFGAPCVSKIVVQPDGKILLAGDFTSFNGLPRNLIARLHPDGTLESTATFNPDLSAIASATVISAIAVQPDGKILVGGSFWATGHARYIARLNPNGTEESYSTFNPRPGPNNGIGCLFVQADGKILITGGFTSVSDQPRNRIARLLPNGALETTATFDPGIGPAGSVDSLAVQADGKILIGGDFTSVSGQPRNRIARLLPNGMLEDTASFNPGMGANSLVTSITMDTGGRILVGGEFSSFGGRPRTCLARLTNGPASQSLFVPDRSRVRWFRGGTAPDPAAVGFDLSHDGGASWISLGAGTRMAGGWEKAGLSLPATGHMRAWGTTTGGVGNGSSGIVAQNAPFSAAPASSAGIPDAAFTPTVDGSIYAVAVQPNGKFLIGGAFTSANGQSRHGIARFHADGTLESTATFNPGTGTDGAVNAVVVQADGKILIGGDFSSVGGHPRSGIARLNPDGTAESTATFNPGTGVSGFVRSIAVQADGKIIIGGWFFSVNGQPRNGVARLNPNGAVESTATFNPGSSVSGYVNSVAVQANGRILIGGWFSLPNDRLTGIARLLSNGTLESTASFNPPLAIGGIIEGVAVQPDGRIVVGGSEGIFRLSAGGAQESTETFDPGTALDGTVNCLALQADGRILLGGEFSTTVNGDVRRRIARLGANGKVEGANEFKHSAGADAPVNCIALQADGKILAGGEFTSVDGRPHARIVRLLNDTAVRVLTIPISTRVEWRLGGASPDVSQVTFGLSTDGGSWSPPGPGFRIAGGWAYGLSLPASGYVRARGRATDGDGSSGIVETIAAFPASALQSWRQAHFGSPFDSGDAGDGADPDLDGLGNLAEFAFGLHPHEDSAGHWPHGQIVDGEYGITFEQPAGVGGVTYSAEWSARLEPGSWTAIPDSGTAPEHTFRVPVNTNTKLFLRLRVTAP